MKSIAALLLIAVLLPGIGAVSARAEKEKSAEGIDYLVLVNKHNALPEGWEDALQTVTVMNSVGDEAEVETKACDAYLQDIMDRFTEQYGADYAAKTVAAPGFSEHHTGLALDLYFRLKGDDGKFTDVYYNEDLVQYPEVWEKIHAKLAGYGFILRYPEGEEQITGYSYEPWHIRYLDNAEIAKEITEEGLTLEEYLSGTKTPDGQRAEKTV